MRGASEAFWISASGQVWGPYPRARMALFARERRLSERTLVAAAPEGPFVPAAALPGLAGLLGAAEGAEEEAPRPSERAPRMLLLLTPGLREGEEARLPASGAPAALRVCAGGFLLFGAETPAECRNRLTRAGYGQDGLCVFEIAGEGAWFNLGKDLDRRLREVLGRIQAGAPSDGALRA